jgi:chemotaxis protein MotA
MTETATLIGLALSLGGILIGNALEGGSIFALVQGTAAFIVFGGTAGAVFVGTRAEDLRVAKRLFKWVWRRGVEFDPQKVSSEIVEAAKKAKTESPLALEADIPKYSSPFMQKAVRLAIDNVDPKIMREILETDIHVEEEKLLAGARVWADAGGYAPTIGIIGAVLGLIAVMNHLTDTSQLGKGIAVAFVATIYGVASANLLFLPMSQKIKRKVKLISQYKQMIVEGSIAITQGLSPTIVREIVHPFLEASEQ